MTPWQRRARLVIGVFAIVFAVIVVFAFKRRAAAPSAPLVVRTDPGAVIESTGGRVERFSLSRKDVRVEYDKQLTYADRSMKMIGVRIIIDDRGGRSFTMTGKEGQVGQGESIITLNGDVRLVSSDGMAVVTDHATYTNSDGLVRAPGPIEFSGRRLTGSGAGMTYDKDRDVLSILDHTVVHVVGDEKGAGAADITSGGAAFARKEKYVRFERGVKIAREGQVIESTSAVAYLSGDEKRIERLELRGNSRITAPKASAGALQSLAGRDMNLKYRADGEALERAVIVGDAVVQVAADAGKPGRHIASSMIDIVLSADGSTPTALVGRDSVQLTLPAESSVPARTIRSNNLEAKGYPGRGLTRAQFSGNVQYRERGSAVDRAANAATLDVVLKPGMSAIEEARFAHAVRFDDGSMTALAAAARYEVDKGMLELTGSEPGATVPRVVNDQIAVDAARIEVTLAGPKLKATGAVKSVLKPHKGGGSDAKSDTKLPSMLKQDQAVNVTGNSLDYDGEASSATYTGAVALWQGDRSVKGDSIVVDDRTGDLSATGSVTTTTMLEEVGKDQKKQRVRSVATARAFQYEDTLQRATYMGDAHMTGPGGDMTAAKIELYLKPSGDELERAEAYDSVTLRDQRRKTTGTRLTYTTADERYVVTGAPVTIIDECGRETIGRTLTYLKSAETIVVDGNEQTRTQTKGGGRCQ